MSQLQKVLIVDDDAIYLTIAESMVRKAGYSVLVARDGREAIAKFKEYSDEIGCVLLDIQMPNMNGIETLQHLRLINEDVRVVIISGMINEAKKDELVPLKPLELLSKPIDYPAVLSVLTKYMS